MAKQQISPGNDTLFKLTGFKDDSAGGGFLNAATVSVTVYESDGVTEVTGIVWPITLAFVATSSGDYEGIVQSTISLVVGQQYIATIIAVEAGINGEWDIELFAARREV